MNMDFYDALITYLIFNANSYHEYMEYKISNKIQDAKAKIKGY